MEWLTATSWVEKSRKAEICNFRTDNCKFPTEDIIGAQNFNFGSEFPWNMGFLAPNFVLWGKNFPTRINFFDRLKFGWGQLTPPATTPLVTNYCHLMCNMWSLDVSRVKKCLHYYHDVTSTYRPRLYRCTSSMPVNILCFTVPAK